MEYEAISSVFFSKYSLMKNKLGEYQVQPTGSTSVIYKSSKSLKEAFSEWISAGTGTKSTCSGSLCYLLCDVLQDQLNFAQNEMITWMCLGKKFRVRVRYSVEVVADDLTQLLYQLREAVYGKRLAILQPIISQHRTLKIAKLRENMFSLITPNKSYIDDLSSGSSEFPIEGVVLPYVFLKLLDDILSQEGDGQRFEIEHSDSSKIVKFRFGNFLHYEFALLSIPSTSSHMKLSFPFGGFNMENFDKLNEFVDTFQISRSASTNQTRVEISHINRKFSTFITDKSAFPKHLLSILESCEFRFEKNMGKYSFVKETNGEIIPLPSLDIDAEIYFERHDPRMQLVENVSESSDVFLPEPPIPDNEPPISFLVDEHKIKIENDAEDFILTEQSKSYCVVCVSREEPKNLKDYMKHYHFVGRDGFFEFGDDSGCDWLSTATKRLNYEGKPNLVFFSCVEEFIPYRDFLNKNSYISYAIGKPIIQDAVALDLTQKGEDDVALANGKTHFFSQKVKTEDCYEFYVEGDSYISPGLNLVGSLSKQVIFTACDALRSYLGKSEVVVILEYDSLLKDIIPAKFRKVYV